MVVVLVVVVVVVQWPWWWRYWWGGRGFAIHAFFQPILFPKLNIASALFYRLWHNHSSDCHRPVTVHISLLNRDSHHIARIEIRR